MIGTQEELDADEEAMGAERASDYRKELTAAHARVCQSGGSCRWSLGGFSKCLSPEVNCARPTTGLISESPSPFDEDVLLRLLMLQRVVDLRHCSFACKAWNRACQTESLWRHHYSERWIIIGESIEKSKPGFFLAPPLPPIGGTSGHSDAHLT